MEKKMNLSHGDLQAVSQAKEAVKHEWLDPLRRRPNVLGVAAGVKWTNGQPTGKPAVLVLVSQKVYGGLSKDEMVPTTVSDVPTDVVAIGYPQANVDLLPTLRKEMPSSGETLVDGMNAAPRTVFPAAQPVAPEVLKRRMRPAPGGVSVGHYAITAGTLSTCVYDFLPGATINPPAYGIGIPAKYYILSNNHVLANSNAGCPGDPILQPGPYDGGTYPADVIATLSRSVPIQFYPPLPLNLHQNIVDAAIAEAKFEDIDRLIYWMGPVRGWLKKSEVNVGLLVKKTGRTTNTTFGRVIGINATVDVGYGNGKVARFTDQIITTPMSAGGDSGSLILSAQDSMAAGLLFAGSTEITIANQIENVRALLRVELFP